MGTVIQIPNTPIPHNICTNINKEALPHRSPSVWAHCKGLQIKERERDREGRGEEGERERGGGERGREGRERGGRERGEREGE